MIDLYYWPTPNGHKITMFLEETGLEYRIVPVNIGTGAQFEPAFLAIAPNNRMPAIVDTAPPGGGAPLAVFESGAILLYLAEKSAQLLPHELHARFGVLQWLFWQMAGLGPMAGQNGHFRRYATEQLPYAIDRYTNETHRLYNVLNRRLADRPFIAGEYSIADMALWPWVSGYEWSGVSVDEFARLKRWLTLVGDRPAVQAGRDVPIKRDRAAEIEAAKKTGPKMLS